MTNHFDFVRQQTKAALQHAYQVEAVRRGRPVPGKPKVYVPPGKSKPYGNTNAQNVNIAGGSRGLGGKQGRPGGATSPLTPVLKPGGPQRPVAGGSGGSHPPKRY